MTRPFRALALAVALGLPLWAATSAPAQAPEQPGFFDVPQEPEDPNAEKGDPVPGYLATAALACGVLFIFCKTARR